MRKLRNRVLLRQIARLRYPQTRPGALDASALIAQADSQAEKLVAIVRFATGLSLIILLKILIQPADLEIRGVALQVHQAKWLLGLLLLSGIVSYVLVKKGWWRPWQAYVTVAFDLGLVLWHIRDSLRMLELTSEFTILLPGLLIVPALFAATALRFRPHLSAFAVLLFLTGVCAVVAEMGMMPYPERYALLGRLAFMFGQEGSLVRSVMFVLAGAVMVVVAWRGRRLLESAIAETVRRMSLSRFLPGEIASLMTAAEAGALREGRRQLVTVAFIDMRDSTMRAESLDPKRLSVFIAAFRRRILASAQKHGGVIDKFIGDGAMVLFGVPEPKEDDACRAVAFAEDLIDRIERWNRKRRFEPPVRIGLGLHTGEVYCGVVGDDARIEFTVLGDAVNVAARLEQATKRFATPILASETTIAAIVPAPNGKWCEVAREPLRGRTEIIAMMGMTTLITSAGEPAQEPSSQEPSSAAEPLLAS